MLLSALLASEHGAVVQSGMGVVTAGIPEVPLPKLPWVFFTVAPAAPFVRSSTGPTRSQAKHSG